MTDLENLKRILNGENVLDVQEDPNMSVGEPASFPEVEKAQVDAQNAQINEKAKAPSQKTKEELQLEELRKAQGDYEKLNSSENSNGSNNPPAEDDMLTKYKKAINAYESKLNAPDKEYGAMDALPDILAGLYNIGVRAKGGVLPEMKMPNAIGTAKAQESAARKDQLSGLKNIQDMYAKYMALQERSKSKALTELEKAKINVQNKNLELQEAKLKYIQDKKEKIKPTEGEKVVDREFAKEYNKWATGGKADYEVNSKIFKDAIEDLRTGKVDTGSISGIGSNIPGIRTETRELEDKVRKAINGMLRATLGAQFTEKEGERIFAQTFDPFKSPEANREAMKLELDKIEKRKDAIEDMGKYYKKNKTMSGYEVPQAKSEESSVDPKIKGYADQYGLDYEKAEQILRARGYNG